MALEAVGSNPTIHPIFIRTACVRYSGFDYRMRAIIILGCRQAVRQRTLTPSPRGFESRQPSQKKGLCVLQSPFFNKINPLGICETALYAVKCLRMFIKRKTADLRNHLAQQLRVFQHGARAQVVLVERLAIVVRHEERRLQDFEQCFFADVGIGIVDEHARAASPPV